MFFSEHLFQITNFEKSGIIEKMSAESIVEWYKGRSIFVTGGTGFMGKVFLEKLLRSCPDVKAVYVVVRPKRGMAPNTRIAEITKLPLFQLLRETNPGVLKKLIAIEGDLTIEGLGINSKMRKIITEDVSVVFHNAATLKLEADLKDSVKHNLVGTINVFNFCKDIKNLEAFIHLSTAFCHVDKEVLDEKIYPPTKNPADILNIVKWMDDKSLELITPTLIEPHPNTYTFTKRLGETIANEFGQTMPVSILRPSIVIPTIMEPIPGWVDSLNGPVGVMAAAGKGVIRSMLVEAGNHAELAPVDIAANCMIAAAWHRATFPPKNGEVPVYNFTQGDVFPITWGEILKLGRTIFHEHPLDWPLWYPGGDIRTNRFVHNVIVFLFQIIPAYFMDFVFTLALQKRFFVRIQKRIKLGMHLLEYFTLREWRFKNDKFLNMIDSIPEKEREIFYVRNVELIPEKYFKNAMIGARQYCLKEKPENIPFAKRYMTFLYYLDKTCKTAILVGFCYLLLQISTKIQIFHEHYYSYTKSA